MAQASNVIDRKSALEIDDRIHLGVASDGFDLEFDGTNTLNVDPVNANDIVRIGETRQADLHVDGATDLVWDASAGSLKNGTAFVPVIFDAVRQVVAAGAGGALSVATYGSDVSSDANGEALTLADGTVVGQLKEVVLDATAGGTAVITPANFADGTTVTLTGAGDYAKFMWNGTNWRLVSSRGVTVA